MASWPAGRDKGPEGCHILTEAAEDKERPISGPCGGHGCRRFLGQQRIVIRLFRISENKLARPNQWLAGLGESLG